MRRALGWFLLALATTVSACASAPPPLPAPPEPTADEKMSWVLRLEDERVLRDPLPAPPPVTTPEPRNRAPVVVPPPSPDLVRLLGDAQPRIRRRAALAVGRVGLAEGVAPLVVLLADPEAEVREMAAFGLGLIADRSARDPLIAALADPSLLVRGSAAEALGLLGDTSAAEPIARTAREIVDAGTLDLLPDGQADVERGSPAGVFRLAVYALARLRTYPALASVVLDVSGQPRVRWWPVAYALQRLEEPAAQPALRTLLSDPHTYTRALAAKGLGATRDRLAVPALLPLAIGGDRLTAIEAVRALARIGDPSATPTLAGLLRARETPAALRREAIAAVASLGGEGVADTLIDYLGDPGPAIRAAALEGLARLDPEGFVFILSGIDPDPHWSVRAALAHVLGSLESDVGLPRLRSMLNDADQRVVAGVLSALANRRAPDAGPLLIEKLKAADSVVRATAARALAELAPPEAIDEMYPPGFDDWIELYGPLVERFEGEHRPGHFRGVTTVVARLFRILEPDRVYFGQKDAQQLRVVLRMVEDLALPVDVIAMPIVREPDGLALSSRNVYLSPEDRAAALVLSRSLRHAEALVSAGETSTATIQREVEAMIRAEPRVVLEYAALTDEKTLEDIETLDRPALLLLLGRLGNTRLLDNAILIAPGVAASDELLTLVYKDSRGEGP